MLFTWNFIYFKCSLDGILVKGGGGVYFLFFEFLIYCCKGVIDTKELLIAELALCLVNHSKFLKACCN